MTAVVRWVESVVALPSPLGLRGAPIVICPCVGLRSTWFMSVFFFFFFLRGEEGEYWKIGKVDLTILCIDHHTAASILQERKAAEALEAGRTTSLIVSLLRSGITSDGFGILSDD